MVLALTSAAARRRHLTCDRGEAPSEIGLRRRGRPAERRRETKGHAAKSAAARWRHSPYGTDATPWLRDSPRHGDRGADHRTSRDVWGPTPLAAPDDRRHSSAIVRRASVIDQRAGRRDERPHAERAWIRVRPVAPTLCSGSRNLWVPGRGSSNSTKVERWGEIFGLEGLDEREDSMRSRASLPFGQLSSFGRCSALTITRRARSTGPNLAARDVAR